MGGRRDINKEKERKIKENFEETQRDDGARGIGKKSKRLTIFRRAQINKHKGRSSSEKRASSEKHGLQRNE